MASGATDAEVMRQALRSNRLLLTEDKDFGELAFRLRLPVPGLVLLRINPERQLLKWPRLKQAIERFGGRLFGRYVVVEEARFHSRPLFDSTRG